MSSCPEGHSIISSESHKHLRIFLVQGYNRSIRISTKLRYLCAAHFNWKV